MAFGNAAEFAIIMTLTENVSQGLDTIGQKAGSLGNSLSAFGTKMTKSVTLPIAGVAAVAVKTAVDFESAFAGVIKTTDGLADEMGNLTDIGADMKQGFRDLAKEVPIAFEELAKIGELGGQLGIARENLVDFSRVIAAMGVSTNLTTEAAAVGFAQIANIMGTAQEDIERMGSSIVHLGNNFATTEADILNFAQRIAGAGKIAGLTESEVFAIGAAFSSVGVQAEAGGTAVQKVLLSITQAVAGGIDEMGNYSDQLDVLSQVMEMSAEDFIKAWEKDPAEVFTAFVEKLGTEGDNAINILGNLDLNDQRLIRSFLSLAGAGDLLADTIEGSATAWEENTALSAEAEARYRTTESQVEILKNTFKDVAATIGDVLLPVVNDIITMLKPFIDRLTEINPEALKMGLIIAGIVAAVGPLLIVLGTLISVGGTLIGTVFSPIGLIIGGVVLALLGLKAAFDNNILGFKDFVTGILERLPSLEDLKEFFADLKVKIDLLVTAFTHAGEVPGQLGEALEYVFGPEMAEKIMIIYEKIQELGEWFSNAKEWFGPLTEAVQEFGLFSEETGEIIGKIFGPEIQEKFNQFSEVFNTVWSTIQEVFNTAMEIIRPAWEQFVEGVKAGFEAITPVIEQFKSLWQALGPFVAAIAGLIGGIIVTVIGVIISVFSGIANAIQPFIETVLGVVQGLVQMFQGLIEIITGILQTIWGLITGNQELISKGTEKFLSGVKNLWDGFKNGLITLVTGMIDTVVNFVSGFYDSIVKWFTDLYNKIVGQSIIKDLVDGVVNFIQDMIDTVVRLVTDWVNDVVTFFTNLYKDVLEEVKKFIDIGKEIVAGLKQGIIDAWDSFVSWVIDKAQGLIDAFLKKFGIKSPSTVFADIGSNVMEGFMQGIEIGAAEVSDNLVRTGEDFTGHFITGLESQYPGGFESWAAYVGSLPQYVGDVIGPEIRKAGEELVAEDLHAAIEGADWILIGGTWRQKLQTALVDEGLRKVLDEMSNLVNVWGQTFFGDIWKDMRPGFEEGKLPEPPPPESPPVEPPGYFDLPKPGFPPPSEGFPLDPTQRMGLSTVYNIYPTYGAYSNEITLTQDIKLMEMMRK